LSTGLPLPISARKSILPSKSSETTFDEIQKDPLGPIWIRPIDYNKVTGGTRFDPESRRTIRVYRRAPEREQLVENSVEKQRLLADKTISNDEQNQVPFYLAS